jgi:LPPG:FO 2-phospho-L-lactate transferase
VRVTVLVGGVGGARFLLGLKAALGIGGPTGVGPAAGESEHEITAVVNVGDDIWLHGLRICPDLDSCMYTLGGGIDPERGWGRAGETWAVRDELAAYGADPSWFGLGDRDTATHLVRTRMLRAGYPLSDVTAALCHRWQPGVTLLPVTDDRVETHVVIDDPETGPQARKAIHFQEWWIRHKAAPAPHSFASIGALLDVPGAREALRAAPARVVGLSPIVGGRPLRGMADACLAAIGVQTSADAVGRHYGARATGGLLDGWLVHTGDPGDVPGVEVREVPLLMTDVHATAEMARRALELCGVGVD